VNMTEEEEFVALSRLIADAEAQVRHVLYFRMCIYAHIYINMNIHIYICCSLNSLRVQNLERIYVYQALRIGCLYFY
jgi:hypothetical protein